MPGANIPANNGQTERNRPGRYGLNGLGLVRAASFSKPERLCGSRAPFRIRLRVVIGGGGGWGQSTNHTHASHRTKGRTLQTTLDETLAALSSSETQLHTDEVVFPLHGSQ